MSVLILLITLLQKLLQLIYKVAYNVRGLAMLGQQRFVTPELKLNIVDMLIVITKDEQRSVELVTKGK